MFRCAPYAECDCCAGNVRALVRRFAGRVEQSAERTALDGVYTEAQAERGMRAYMEQCSRCHYDDLRGNPVAPGLTGTRFIEAWREDSLFSLFDHMATRMPREPRRAPDACLPRHPHLHPAVQRLSDWPAGTDGGTAQSGAVRRQGWTAAPPEPRTRARGGVFDACGEGHLDADGGDRAGARQRRENDDP